MKQTENTAIVLRHANYRDNDRMLTLLSPSRGRLDVMLRNCRKPKSHNLNSGELFALGDYMLHENGGHITVTSVKLIETFYPLRNDYDRLTCGIYLLNLAYELFRDRNQESAMTMPVRILFIVLFLVFAVGLMVYAVRLWRGSGKAEEEDRKREEEMHLK